MMKSAKISTTIILVVIIIIIVNILGENYKFRLDLTEGKEYTLSKATRDILKNLDKPVTITAYFSKNLPANLGNLTGDLRDMLIEYGERSKGMVVYKFVNPGESSDLENEAVQNGVRPIMINVREKDQVKQQKAFMGAVITMERRKKKFLFSNPVPDWSMHYRQLLKNYRWLINRLLPSFRVTENLSLMISQRFILN